MESSFLKDLGLVVRRLRRERGMTQADLADRLGLSRTSITNLESGDQNPSLSLLPALARALGIAPENLVAEAMGRSPQPKSGLETRVADVELRRWASSVITDLDSGAASQRSNSRKVKRTSPQRRVVNNEQG